MNRERREFLAEVGKGMLVATVGTSLAVELGLEPIWAGESNAKLEFGDMEPIVDLMTSTPIEKLQAAIVAKHHEGIDLRTLTAAAALANARAFGGQDYDGYHTFMALGPALDMASELPVEHRLLPLLKVFYRNTNRIQKSGANENEVLYRIELAKQTGQRPDQDMLRRATRDADMDEAEKLFAVLASSTPEDAYNQLLYTVQDEVDVHRTVLAWRAWTMLDVTGRQHAHTLLRQSIRFCVDSEQRRLKKQNAVPEIRELLPRLLDEYRLQSVTIGNKNLSDESLSDLSIVIFKEDRARAATAVAAAIAEGVSADAIGEALSLAANRLLLNDPGRKPDQASSEKPAGSVHGASVGVHAMDSANAWRNIARVSNPRNQITSLIVGAYHTAGQAKSVGVKPLEFAQAADELSSVESSRLPDELAASVRAGQQLRACATIFEMHRKKLSSESVFATLLPFAISEDGALHAEKFYRTVREEFVRTRSSQQWNHLIGLARVTASEYGHPAPGQEEARQMLKLPT